MYTPYMNPNDKKRILWSLVFALAIVASAFLFKGNPALYWIEAALVVAALYLCHTEIREAWRSPLKMHFP
jgi:hypothetical protein